jgi:hypothetical protein
MIAIGKYLFAPFREEPEKQAQPETQIPEPVARGLVALFDAVKKPVAEDLGTGFPDATSNPECAVRIGLALKEIAADHEKKAEELRDLLGLLADLTETVNRGAGESQERLQAVESGLRKAAGVSDLLQIRQCLRLCLAAAQEEEAAREAECSMQLLALAQSVDSLRRVECQDPFAGSREETERLLAKRLWEEDRPGLAVRFDQLALTERRFGASAVEAVVHRYLEELQGVLGELVVGHLIQWKDHCYLFFLTPTDQAALRTSIERVPCRRVLYVSGRRADIALDIHWSCFDRRSAQSPSELIDRLSQFTTG